MKKYEIWMTTILAIILVITLVDILVSWKHHPSEHGSKLKIIAIALFSLLVIIIARTILILNKKNKSKRAVK